MVLVSLLKAFWIPITIWLVTNGLNYYRSARAAYNSNKDAIRPPPPAISRILNLLFVFALGLVIASFWSPENIFKLTNGRLQTSIDVIFTRLGAIRPLSETDGLLKAKLASKASRLIYFAHGPDALLSCTFCDSGDPNTYAIYALPSQLAPHILNALVLGTATSSLAGPEGTRWRGVATIAICALVVADLGLSASYDVTLNTLALKTEQIDFFFWRMRTARPLALAALDAVFGWVLWISSTNRFFVKPPTLKDRLGRLAVTVDQVNKRSQAASVIRDTVRENKGMRDQAERYWAHEQRIFNSDEVALARTSALSRFDMRQFENLADQKVEEIVSYLNTGPASAEGAKKQQ